MSSIFSKYKPRSIRFLDLIELNNWKVKLYSISSINEIVPSDKIKIAKAELTQWLDKSKNTQLQTYQVATLILHEWHGGCFAVVNWWIDDNMLQHYVYLASNEEPNLFKLYSANGVVTCVWELAVLWHERNAWVKHILEKNMQPDFSAYLKENLNADV